MISIIDYGVGNVRAFLNIYKKLGYQVQLANNIIDLKKSTKIILPGVGNFDYAMQKLEDSQLLNCLNDLVLRKKIPVLGVCVGMQIMALSSEEGNKKGLGWIDAKVKKFDVEKINFKPHLPHMGWNNVIILSKNKILDNFPPFSKFYFLHSYYIECNDKKNDLASTNYGINFSSIVNKENIYGIQCHPEKSHQFGINLLENFAKL